MSFLTLIKSIFAKKKGPPPNPLIPWEIYPFADPCIDLRCTQGEQEAWCTYIWLPYWATLSKEQQNTIKAQAPSLEWIKWIEFKSSMVSATREYFQKNELEFDYQKYLQGFCDNYTKSRK